MQLWTHLCSRCFWQPVLLALAFVSASCQKPTDSAAQTASQFDLSSSKYDRAAIRQHGEALRPVIVALLKTHKDHAFLLLAQLAPEAEWAVPLLRQELQDNSSGGGREYGAFRAALVLTRFPGQAETTIPCLFDNLKVHKPQLLQHSSMIGLGMGEQAYWAIRRLGPEAVPYILPALKHESEAVRTLAVRLLAARPPQPEKWLPLFKEALADKSIAVRREAVAALEPYGAAAVEPLLNLLQNKDLGGYHRHVIVKILARLGPTATAAVPVLIERLELRGPSDQLLAAQALLRIERRADAILPRLAKGLLPWSEPFWMFPAVHEFEPEAQAKFVAAVEKLRQQPIGPDDARQATAILARLKNDVSYWAEQLKHAEVSPRLQAMEALAEAGPRAKAAAPPLHEMLGDKLYPLVRARAVLTLWRIEKNKEEALKQIQPVLADLNAQGPSGRIPAAQLLWEVNRQPEEALALLTRRLGSRYVSLVESEEIHSIARLLGAMGPAARDSWPLLYHVFLVSHWNAQPLQPEVLAALARALEQIEPAPEK